VGQRQGGQALAAQLRVGVAEGGENLAQGFDVQERADPSITCARVCSAIARASAGTSAVSRYPAIASAYCSRQGPPSWSREYANAA
jgi:hypothetical protein